MIITVDRMLAEARQHLTLLQERVENESEPTLIRCMEILIRDQEKDVSMLEKMVR